MKTQTADAGALLIGLTSFAGLAIVIAGWLFFLHYAKRLAHARIPSDADGHYDMDGVSLSGNRVVVASDASY